MYKTHSLRRHLAQAVPELARDPDKLSILVRNGRVQAAGEASLSFEYAATVQIIVLDHAGPPDAIVLPLLVWLRTHQPEYFDNTAQREQAFRFEAEYNNATTIDLSIELDLTERVQVQPVDMNDHSAPGRFNVQHIGEPPYPGHLTTQERWSFWLREELIAEWDCNPLDLNHAPPLSG